jgi:hypothetical protein
LLERFERNISILGRSQRTFDNYSRHIAAMALHFACLPTELDEEQIKDYLYELQQRSKTPSQTYFKHTVYGLRFMLKGEGLPYSLFIFLPSKEIKSTHRTEQSRSVAYAENRGAAQTQNTHWAVVLLRTQVYGSKKCKIERPGF